MVCSFPGSVDLHIHSTASDGTFTPAEIAALANKAGLSAIAITDHDTIDGAKALCRIAAPPSVETLSGVEISADPPEGYSLHESFHILGYGFALDYPPLINTLSVLQKARKNRNPMMVRRLQRLGIDISLRSIKQLHGEGQLGRPHIASYLTEKGVVGSIDEAFDKYLGYGKPAYVSKKRLSCGEAIRLISDAGGIPVLAHPGLLERNSGKAFDQLLKHLSALGVIGLEAYYPEHTPAQIQYYLDVAKRYHLLITGGTDFHGAIKPSISLGCANGDFFVPYTCYAELKKKIEELTCKKF